MIPDKQRSLTYDKLKYQQFGMEGVLVITKITFSTKKCAFIVQM